MADAAAFETVSISPTEYDVFLSFRGKENFTSHLYTALTKAGFRTFLGDGEEVSINRSELNEAIHKSRVFIIVFSQHYLSSRCCLDDLLMILSCKRRYRRVVIPVFLSVDPSDVRHQTGSIAEAMKFVRHQYIYTEMDRKTKQKVKKQKVKILGLIIKKNRKSYTEMDHKTKQKLMADLEAKIGKWREALTEAGNLMSGIYLGNIDHDPEEKFIKKVVERIVEELRIKVGFAEEVLTSAQGLVGVPNYKINIEDWENAPQKKTVVSRAQRFHEYLQLEHASLLDHYDKSLITDNKQLMTRNLLPDSGQLKKVVLKVELYDDKVKQKAMKVVAGLSGVVSIAMNMKDKNLTVTGDTDPVTIVSKLRKLCHTEIVSVGPAKEPEKMKEYVKKEEPKKKDDPKKEEPKKKDDPVSRMKTNAQVSAYIPQPNELYLKLGNLELIEMPKAEEWDTKEIHLMNNRLSELPDNPKCPALEKLFLQSNYDLTEIPSTFFECMPVLQVLDLSNTSIKSLNIPSISRLVELQELLLRGCELLMELPPQIGLLKNLKVFDLEGTEIVYLPKELRELINLECLKFSLYGYADSYKESKGIDAIIPRATLSKLNQLKELSINVDPCGEWWNVEVEAIFEELPSLRKLETLKLYVPTAELLQQFVQLEWNANGLSMYSNLSHFRLIVGSQQQHLISRVPFDLEEEFLKLEKCLKYINGEGNTNQFAEAIKHANTLFLDRHWSIEKLSVFKIDKLNELKDCLLVDCNEMHTVFDGSDFYEGDNLSLQNLHIYYLKNLEFIWKGPVVGSCLPHLKILALHMCPNLTTIVTPMLLQNMEHLEEIIVEDCSKIETLVILDSSHPTLSNHSLQSLKKISLSYLPELVNLFSDQCIVPKLETTDIYDCPKLKILSSVEVCNKEIIKGEWWDALECNEPERSSEDFSQLDVDQLAADGYSLRLFLKDREALQ